MQDFDYARLTYLIVLGSALVFWFLVQNRDSLSVKFKQASAWVFIFIGVVAAYGLWEDQRTTTQSNQARITAAGDVIVPRSQDGHYYLTLDVNGMPLQFLVDTGASDIVLSKEDASRVGLDIADLEFHGRALTANGEVRTAQVNLNQMTLGEIVDRNVPASVNDGDLWHSLLGMAYLQRWSRIEITGDGLRLSR